MNSSTVKDDGEVMETIHRIDIPRGSFPDRIECGDLIEFHVNDQIEYDLFQVFPNDDGDEDFSPVKNGLALSSVNKDTPVSERRLSMSFDLEEAKIDLYFCWIPSVEREKFSSRCPKDVCEKNRLQLFKSETKIALTDNRESQQITLHQGETIEVSWASKRAMAYRMEEKHYCPISGGLYSVHSDRTAASSKGSFRQTFGQFGMSFLFRLTENNQIHDILVCTINKKHKIKHIPIHQPAAERALISIEQNESIVFQWHTEQKLTVKLDGEELAGPASRRGYRHHRFDQCGLFSYQIGEEQAGSVLVQPRREVHRFAVFGEQLSEFLEEEEEGDEEG